MLTGFRCFMRVFCAVCRVFRPIGTVYGPGTGRRRRGVLLGIQGHRARTTADRLSGHDGRLVRIGTNMLFRLLLGSGDEILVYLRRQRSDSSRCRNADGGPRKADLRGEQHSGHGCQRACRNLRDGDIRQHLLTYRLLLFRFSGRTSFAPAANRLRAFRAGQRPGPVLRLRSSRSSRSIRTVLGSGKLPSILLLRRRAMQRIIRHVVSLAFLWLSRFFLSNVQSRSLSQTRPTSTRRRDIPFTKPRQTFHTKTYTLFSRSVPS